MYRLFLPAASALLLVLASAHRVSGQEWRPPTTEMPRMPTVEEMRGNWIGSRANWLSGAQAISGVDPSRLTAVGDARRGSSTAQVVRFNQGPVPVVVWQDRNGDGRADMIEIFRGGGVAVQVIDADYDGRANVMRRYDPGGTLIGEERL